MAGAYLVLSQNKFSAARKVTDVGFLVLERQINL